MFNSKLNYKLKCNIVNNLLKKMKLTKMSYFNLELIMNKYNLGTAKRQLIIKNNNQVDPSNTVYNCRNLRYINLFIFW